MSQVLITTDAIGGVWSYSLALAAGLAAAGHRCTLAVAGPPPRKHQMQAAAEIAGCDLVDTGLALDWLAPDRGTLDGTIEALASLAARLGATSAHLHAPCLASGAWGVPVVVTAHSCMATWWDNVRGGARPDGFAWHAAATLEGLQRATHVIAPSHAFADDLRRAYAFGRPVEVIHNGLPCIPASNPVRQDYVLAAGRLWDAGKNIAVLDEAAARTATPIRVAGPLAGPDGATFTPSRLMSAGNLAPACLRAMMARAAVFAAPSLYEPFGLCVLEAAQTGAPLVLADIPTFRELWTGAALFVPPRDPAAWASTLDTLMADPARRHALGEAARTRAASYTQAAMVHATAALHAADAQSRQAA